MKDSSNNKLIPYWITVRKRGDPDTQWDQTNIHHYETEFPKNNLADYFEAFLKAYQGETPDECYVDKNKKKTFRVGECLKRKDNTIEGLFKSGEYGTQADLLDIQAYERIEDGLRENQAPEIPFYFLFHIPDVHNSQALLLLRRYKRKGVKTILEELFLPRNQDEDIGEAYVTIEPHYSDKVAKKLEEADRIASVRFRGKKTLSAREEYADRKSVQNVDGEYTGRFDVDVELKYDPKNKQEQFVEFLKGLLPGAKEKNFDYGKIERQDFSSAKVTVMEGNSPLTFSLWEEKIRIRMDLNPEDERLVFHGGHPTPHSLGIVARQLANDLMADINTDLNLDSLISPSVGVPDAEQQIQTQTND